MVTPLSIPSSVTTVLKEFTSKVLKTAPFLMSLSVVTVFLVLLPPRLVVSTYKIMLITALLLTLISRTM
ncbi:hypothetical protein ES705_50616 [subsurface metagenome]